jgi:methionyl-tRNA synthetase
MLEAVQTDVYVRARKLAGDDVIFMWADDTHGTPIQLRAQSEGIAPEELIGRAYDEHVADFGDFGIGFDIFHTTHSEETRQHSEAIFKAVEARGDVISRDVEQLYCPKDEMFLPDRFVRGKCPKCGAEDQYGDACEVCSTTYAPTDLGGPHCSMCGTEPELKSSEHLFVPLSRHEGFLREWLQAPRDGGRTLLQDTVRNYVMSWVDGGLRDWDISRDGPYFGFEIPGHPGKFFYVWFDAPIGYVAATQKWCAEQGRDFDAYWKNPDGDTEIVHVIGKDIVYFHCLFWPAMLHAAGYTTPRRVHVHGWLTVDGEKMSKTRGTFVLARTYLNHASPDYLRYYFTTKLSAGQDDIDLSLEDFINRVNADLVKKAANLASRCAKFLKGRMDGRLGDMPDDARELAERAAERLGEARALYGEFEYSRATRLAMQIAEDFNLYLTDAAPWKVLADDPERARKVCSAGLYATKVIATILKPVLPGWAEKVERLLVLERPLDFQNGADPVVAGREIAKYEALAEPLATKAIEAMIEDSKESLAKATATSDYEVPALKPETKIDDFAALDLRVGKILSCDLVEGSKKLLRFTVDLGPLGRRQVFAGIRQSYADPQVLVGKHVAVHANLKPRKMKCGMSEGMVLAAGQGDDDCTVVEIDPRSRPGEPIT